LNEAARRGNDDFRSSGGGSKSSSGWGSGYNSVGASNTAQKKESPFAKALGGTSGTPVINIPSKSPIDSRTGNLRTTSSSSKSEPNNIYVSSTEAIHLLNKAQATAPLDKSGLGLKQEIASATTDKLQRGIVNVMETVQDYGSPTDKPPTPDNVVDFITAYLDGRNPAVSDYFGSAGDNLDTGDLINSFKQELRSSGGGGYL